MVKQKTDIEIAEEILAPKRKREEIENQEDVPSLKFKKVETQDDKDKRTIFLSNVPPEYKPERIRKKFETFGKVEDVRKLEDKIWVQFEKKEIMDQVLSSDKPIFKHSNIEIKRAKTEIDENCSIFISNLSFKTTEKELISIFQPCGRISQIKIPGFQISRFLNFFLVFPDTGKNRGIVKNFTL
jgi:RNA recognition motif-containing protein